MPGPVASTSIGGPGGVLLVILLMLPVIGIVLAFLAGGRFARPIALALLTVGLAVTAATVREVWITQSAVTYVPGGWLPPLGLKLRADGLSAAMLAVTALVLFAIGWYAPADFRVPRGRPETRQSLSFWVLLLAIWVAMNAVFLGNDLFNLYVALELVTFAAVPMVAMSGSPGTLQAALRYLIFALIGSVLYLLGTALLYGQYGTLDITLLASRVQPSDGTLLAAALATIGLAAKTALFPLHLWLPPAHAGAPPSASALLSALVVKGSFFLVVRLWFDVMPGLPGQAAANVLGAMGAGAIVVGGVVAIRQARLKLLIAYSTVAQLGYLFLIFPLTTGALAMNTSPQLALSAGMFQAIAHALAKAAMFLAAGLVAEAAGHDRLADLRGIGRALPITSLAFGLAAVSLIGVPPTGGFFTKWLLLAASISTGQWWWIVVVLAGGLLAGGYMFRFLTPVLAAVDAPLALEAKVSRGRELVVLALAILSLLLGVMPQKPLDLLKIGRVPISQSVWP